MATLYQLVDEDDNLIGYRPPGHPDLKKYLYRITSLWLTNSKGEILIAQRSFNKDNDPGRWAPAVAGTLEADETYDKNIYKEAEEEIGLTGLRFKKGPKQKVPNLFYCQHYSASIDRAIEDFKLQAEEVEAAKWVSASWLKKDVVQHPESYVGTMPEIIELFESSV